MHISTLILLPARSGSKGLPGKNIRLLAGKPLLAWTTDCIKRANLAHSLAVLSTDSEQYAEIGRSLGLEVPFLRPSQLATDQASAIAVVLHALDWFKQCHDYYPEQCMYLQPTSPFRSELILQQALAMLDQHQADAVIGCQEIHRNLTSLFHTDQGYLQALNPQQTMQTNRQQIKPLLTPNGALYLCKTELLLSHQSFYPKRTLPLIMNKVMSLDIDSEEDWGIAEAYVQQGLVS